jgi:hypothetical protein
MLIASGIGSIAIGYAHDGHVIASGRGAIAIGEAVRASADYAVAVGKGFTNTTANSFAVGFGSIAFQVDSSGNATLAGTLKLGAISVPSSPTAGQIYFDGSHFYGYNGSAWLQLDNAA